MGTSLHSNFTGAEIHRPYRQIFANSAARLADATVYSSSDLYKKALQTDTSTEYYLSAISPIVWTAVSPALPTTPGMFNVVGLNSDITTLTTEVSIGGTVFDGSKLASVAYFNLVGVLTSVSGDGDIRLYDLGPSAGPPITPDLRSTLTISFVDSGNVVLKTKTLTPVALPSAPDQIYNTERLYEVRGYLNSATPGETLRILQASIVTYFS